MSSDPNRPVQEEEAIKMVQDGKGTQIQKTESHRPLSNQE